MSQLTIWDNLNSHIVNFKRGIWHQSCNLTFLYSNEDHLQYNLIVGEKMSFKLTGVLVFLVSYAWAETRVNDKDAYLPNG